MYGLEENSHLKPCTFRNKHSAKKKKVKGVEEAFYLIGPFKPQHRVWRSGNKELPGPERQKKKMRTALLLPLFLSLSLSLHVVSPSCLLEAGPFTSISISEALITGCRAASITT